MGNNAGLRDMAADKRCYYRDHTIQILSVRLISESFVTIRGVVKSSDVTDGTGETPLVTKYGVSFTFVQPRPRIRDLYRLKLLNKQ